MLGFVLIVGWSRHLEFLRVEGLGLRTASTYNGCVQLFLKVYLTNFRDIWTNWLVADSNG